MKGAVLLWLYLFSPRRNFLCHKSLIHYGVRFFTGKMVCMKPSQTQDTGNMPRGAYVLPRDLLHHPKCLAVVRTCKGNFVYFVKCPVGSKGHLGILSYCWLGKICSLS